MLEVWDLRAGLCSAALHCSRGERVRSRVCGGAQGVQSARDALPGRRGAHRRARAADQRVPHRHRGARPQVRRGARTRTLHILRHPLLVHIHTLTIQLLQLTLFVLMCTLRTRRRPVGSRWLRWTWSAPRRVSRSPRGTRSSLWLWALPPPPPLPPITRYVTRREDTTQLRPRSARGVYAWRVVFCSFRFTSFRPMRCNFVQFRVKCRDLLLRYAFVLHY